MQTLEPKFEAGCYTTVPWVGLEGVLEHHYDEEGDHQLRYKGRVGDWVPFSEFCEITFKDESGNERTFYGTTKFHWPRPEILEVIPVVPRS